MTDLIPCKRILLKLSGESLMGKENFGIDLDACRQIAIAIKGIRESGVEVALVCGAGNIFRGIQLKSVGMERTPADHMGLLSTVINGIALEQALTSFGCKAKIMSALKVERVAEDYDWRKAQQYLKDGYVLIFVGGTGNPYFTTDTAASLRASEIHADILMKATKVNGVFDKDPVKHSDAVKYDEITYSKVLAEKLKVMDATAIALCMSNNIPIYVFNMARLEDSTIMEILSDKQHGTLVKGE